MHRSARKGKPRVPRASKKGPTTKAPTTSLAFFGLAENPFALSPDPRFFFRSRSHGAALDSLIEAIHRVEGLLVLTGDIGTGKTTLYRALMQQLARRTFSAVLLDPLASREDFLKSLLVDFGVASIGDLKKGRFRGASRTELNYLLQEFLTGLTDANASAIVVIDEAQNLTAPLWEEIRILSDVHSHGTPVHVLLTGQSNLCTRLKHPDMERINQRIAVRCTLEPLNLEETAGFIEHRLHVAGPQPACLFDSEAVDAVFRISAGVPRLISLLCAQSLHDAFERSTTTIERDVVEAAATRLTGSFRSPAGPSGRADEFSGQLSNWIEHLDTAVNQTPEAPLDRSAPQMSRDWAKPHIPLLKRLLGFN